MDNKAIISGVGHSRIGRRLNLNPLLLTIDAINMALADAGLTYEDIDGVCSWPGQVSNMPGLSPVSIWDLREALDLKLNWFSGGGEAPAQMASLIGASQAVSSGHAKHIICFRTLNETSAPVQAGKGSLAMGAGQQRVDGVYQWSVPFHAPSAAIWTALMARSYQEIYGLKREDLGMLAVTQRKHAMLNPLALMQKPLTLDEYMQSRQVAEPLCLFDCDVPLDGSIALIISCDEAAGDLRSKPIRIEASAGCLHSSSYWCQNPDLTHMAAHDVGKVIWTRTDYKPKDVDVAELYDGFSFFAFSWLEALGFCNKGEAAAFINKGVNIGLDGGLPLNTHGGQLSAGRMHGFGHLLEAVFQLRGEAGDRQVKGAKVAVVSNGGGPLGAAALLTNEL